MIGVLSISKSADIIVVPDNPLEDNTVMGNTGFVMKDGRRYKRSN
jgi:imidazolonepropionase-like amidohydrolase